MQEININIELSNIENQAQYKKEYALMLLSDLIYDTKEDMQYLQNTEFVKFLVKLEVIKDMLLE